MAMNAATLQLFDLNGCCVLVTGGSRGLGLQIADALGGAGARVLLTSRSASDLDEAARSLRATGIEADWIAGDASDPGDVARISAEALGRLGRIDVLVNNAGASWGAPAEDYPLSAWDKVMNLNVRSVFLFSQHVAKHDMIPRRGGRIINVASIKGLLGNASHDDIVAYNTSKAALINLTRTLAGEWGEFGINVNAIAPGWFPSKMTRGMIEHQGVAAMASRAPLRRLGDDEDLKGAALLFASRAGKHITGQVLAVDGGVSAVGD
jgi:NAD(P)-dependent dehydrogenase (short-subunit alcohol dehydrogenase family)